MNETVLCLISCAKTKRERACKASRLYSASASFRIMLAIAERCADYVLILSAKHGVLRRADTVAPYDETLLGQPSRILKMWAEKTYDQLKMTHEYQASSTIVWFAGLAYRKYLIGLAKEDGKASVIPLEGLRQGEQRAWLRDNQVISREELVEIPPEDSIRLVVR